MLVTDFILCDDIRQELGNKITIIGVYNDSIVINLPPGPIPPQAQLCMRLAIYVRVKLEAGERPDAFELHCFDEAGDIGTFSGEIAHKNETEIIPVSLLAEQFPVRAGTTIFEFRLKSGSQIVYKTQYPYALKWKISNP